MDVPVGGNAPLPPTDLTPKLSDLGISKSQSSRCHGHWVGSQSAGSAPTLCLTCRARRPSTARADTIGVTTSVTRRGKKLAGRHAIAHGRQAPITGRHELHITVSPSVRLDLDNPLKAVIDAMRRFGLVTDDSPKYLRKLVVEWGEAPEGVRVTVREHK